MRMPALCTAIMACAVIGHPAPAVAQVDQQRAQEYFKEAQALCERDGGRLWGVSICAPMVIGDAQTQTFATSQPPPDAPLPRLIGLLNGPIQWRDTLWAALTWDTIANWPARTRGEAFVHESFYIVQPHLVLNGPAGANEHRDSVELMRALGVLPVADAAAAAARYGGAELRAAEEQREQQRQERIAELRQRFVDGPVFVMPCGGSGTSNSLGAVVIPDAGTVYFHPYRLSGACGTLAADNGVLEASDGRSRRLPAPVRGDDATISGDGWTFKAAAGWVVREGARRGDYDVVRQQP
jgi:hypothetical protein